MPTLACLSPWTQDHIRELAGTSDLDVRLVPDPPAQNEVRAAVLEADLVIGDMRHLHQIDREILQHTKCRFIQQPAAGFDSIDVEAAAEYGIPVANAAGFNADAVADWALMAMLNALRSGHNHDALLRAGGWRPDGIRYRELRGLTVGVIGYGQIGRMVTQRLRGFGSRVLVSDPFVTELDSTEAIVVPLEQLLREADIVTLHVPLNSQTKGLLDADRLALMKPDAIVVNACRGPVVDEAALVAALTAGKLGGAALDVFEVEPLATDSPLRTLPQVFLSPHLAGRSEQAQRNLAEVVGTNLRRFLAGEQPLHIVNPGYQNPKENR